MQSRNQSDALLRNPESFLGRPCLIAAADAVRVQECADVLRRAARAAGYDQVERVDASEKRYDWDELRAVCVSPGLFASRRVLDLRLAQAKLSSAGGKVLLECLESADPDLQWIISLAEWSRKAEAEAWVKALAKRGSVVAMWPLQGSELNSWVARQAKQRGLNLDTEAVDLLLWRTEGNLLATVMELDKLLLADPDQRWSAAKLSAHVADSARFDVYNLIDEAVYGNAARMRRVLHALKAEGVAPAAIIYPLARQLQLMFEMAAARQQGQPSEQLVRSARLYAQRATGYQRALSRHSPSHWERLWIAVGALDRLSKGRGQGSPWVALERLLLRVALPDAEGQRFVA